jgi:hypothetical protein
MGYKLQKKLLKLRFEEYEGLIVKAKSASLGQVLGLMDLAQMDREKITVEDKQRLDELFRLFAAKLVEWNLEDEDGVSVPPTHEGLMDQEMDFVLDIVMGWLEMLVKVPDPLDKRSGAGSESKEETSLLSSGMIPMTAIPT